MAMNFKRRLPIPKEIREEMPLRPDLVRAKAAFDAQVAAVFGGEDARRVLIIGPCSADREDSVLEYMTRRAGLRERGGERLLIIPRVYTNKPRTRGTGYKGLLHNPDPGAADDLLEGVKAIRRMHLRVIEETGMFTADEMLYPSHHQYLIDLLSYVAVGARSVENQEHRLVASGVSVPVGMKNPGPCSADREDSVLEYMTRRAGLRERGGERLLIIPRVYTNKPRTRGTGYKGLLHNPDPGAADDLLEGVKAIRRMHLRVIEETGMFTADEMLYPSHHQYLIDLLSYVAVGARSVENQEHRLVASGVSVPVGMKNPTAGSTTVMLNSIFAAQAPQSFIYRNWEVQTTGNPLAHAVLRGYISRRRPPRASSTATGKSRPRATRWRMRCCAGTSAWTAGPTPTTTTSTLSGWPSATRRAPVTPTPPWWSIATTTTPASGPSSRCASPRRCSTRAVAMRTWTVSCAGSWWRATWKVHGGELPGRREPAG